MTPTRRDQLISKYQNHLLEKASDIIKLAADDSELIAHIVDVDRQYEESEGIAPSEEDQNRSLRQLQSLLKPPLYLDCARGL